MVTPIEAAALIYKDGTARGRQRIYRMLDSNYLQNIGDRIGCPVYRTGNRYLIPMAIIKHIEGINEESKSL